ncbi:hypothetical protein [Jatrophihabitans sp.]|jgi:hypothetical protein|uniref:hypothetical protein n=1 Tax=Jatrophihabitans sp. TaxID=1932789 RepID=UPI002F0CC808
MNPAVRKYVKDLTERVLWTFLEAFFGAAALAYAAAGVDLDPAVTGWSAWEKILIAGTTAGLAAVGALVKGLIASRLGDTGTASTVRLDDLDDAAGSAGGADGPTGLGVLVSIRDGAGPVSMQAGAPATG